jgi:hypothetical protein
LFRDAIALDSRWRDCGHRAISRRSQGLSSSQHRSVRRCHPNIRKRWIAVWKSSVHIVGHFQEVGPFGCQMTAEGTNNGRLGLSVRRASERCKIARGTAQSTKPRSWSSTSARCGSNPVPADVAFRPPKRTFIFHLARFWALTCLGQYPAPRGPQPAR